ncbi:MAG: glycosyltransferase family 4 protein [Mycobacterium sp.]|nr:glycosyltransferase family 4 protein [Mycobacterium sp.]
MAGAGSLSFRLSRSTASVPELATIVAAGPFDDLEHAQQLAAMFTRVQQTCQTRMVLLGEGARRSLVVRRAAERRLQTRLVLVDDCAGPQRSDLLVTADLVIPSPASTLSALEETMAAGRAVVAAASPATAQLVMPYSAGLLYAPGDISAMTAAVVRLLSHPELRDQMGIRASHVARDHRLQQLSRQWPDDLKYA